MKIGDLLFVLSVSCGKVPCWRSDHEYIFFIMNLLNICCKTIYIYKFHPVKLIDFSVYSREQIMHNCIKSEKVIQVHIAFCCIYVHITLL